MQELVKKGNISVFYSQDDDIYLLRKHSSYGDVDMYNTYEELIDIFGAIDIVREKTLVNKIKALSNFVDTKISG